MQLVVVMFSAALGTASYVTVLAPVTTGTVFVEGLALYATPFTLATVVERGEEPGPAVTSPVN